MLDLVVLTDPHYLNPEHPTSSDLDILKEDEYVMSACRDQGLKVDRKSWDDPDFDWSTTRAVIFRTTWDYFDRFGEFESWLKQIKSVTTFINPQELIFWNVDKRYLKDVAKAGIHIVPSHFVERGSLERLSEVADRNNWKELVIKPTISATAKDTFRILPDQIDSSQPLFERLCQQHTMMVQPFLHRVLDEGELSLIVIDGEVTHAVKKRAKPGDYRVQNDFGGSIELYEPAAEEVEFAQKAVLSCPTPPVYARVDLMKDNEGAWALGEMELIEPELWFRLHPQAAERLGQAIAGFLNR